MEDYLDHVPKYDGTLQQLAKDIGSMRYDSVADFLKNLEEDLARQAANDGANGRTQLAQRLEDTVQQIHLAEEKMRHAWNLCKRHMRPKE